MSKISQGISLPNVLRRRSTHTYQSIFIETNPVMSEEGDDLDMDMSRNRETVTVLPSSIKVFVLTTSVTNYFCCGINLRSLFSRLRFSGSPKTWLIDKLGGEEIAGIRKKLTASLVDWFLDTGTTVSHLINGAWIQASLTYLIVLNSGLITTIGFLRDPQIRQGLSNKASRVGRVWSILLYIPTFMSVVSVKLWLHSALEHGKLREHDSETKTSKLEEETKQLKDWALKALWCETVFESKPQALLQTIFLIESTTEFNTVLDFLPILQSMWSTYSSTNTIYDLVTLNFVDRTEIFSKLYGNSYTVLSILAPSMVINMARNHYTSNLGKFIVTLVSLLTYYLVFEIIYQLTYFVAQMISSKKEGKKHENFVKAYMVILLIVFASCATAWVLRTNWQENEVRNIIVLTVFSLAISVNFIAYCLAFDITVEIFRLKNVKIDAAWEKIKARFK